MRVAPTAGLIAFAAMVAASVAASPAIKSNAASDPVQNQSSRMVATMAEARFWDIVDRSRSNNPDEQLQRLQQILGGLTAEEIEQWEATLDQQLKRSYRWDLWGAAFLAMGGASNDGFEYFRLWLVAQGDEAFNRVLSDPDSLADLALDDPEQLEFEEFAYVAPRIWSEKTGKPWDQMPRLASFFSPDGYGPPAGEEFSEDEGQLSKRYPKLWSRFGSGK